MGLLQIATADLLQIVTNLLQIAIGITNCAKFITNCNSCYKLRRLLQIATDHKLTRAYNNGFPWHVIPVYIIVSCNDMQCFRCLQFGVLLFTQSKLPQSVCVTKNKCTKCFIIRFIYLTSHGILHYLWSADLSKNFLQLMMPIFIFSQHFFQ